MLSVIKYFMIADIDKLIIKEHSGRVLDSRSEGCGITSGTVLFP